MAPDGRYSQRAVGFSCYEGRNNRVEVCIFVMERYALMNSAIYYKRGTCVNVRRLVAVVVLLMVLPMLAVHPAYGQSKRQLEKEKSLIEKEIARLNSELSKVKSSSKKSTTQINLLNKRIAERNRLISNINGQLSYLDGQIVRTQDSLALIRGQIGEMKAEYAKVVRTLYGLQHNVNSIGLLFDNQSYNYSYLKMKYFQEYSRYRKYQATMIERKERKYEDMTLDLQRQKNEKSSLLAQERRQKEALSREQQQQQQNLSTSQQQERDLRNKISKKEQQKRHLQAQIQKLINEEVAKSAKKGGAADKGGKVNVPTGKTASSATPTDAASADFVAAKGKMSWPVYYKSVAREFGLYTHASGGQNRNYGIDLVCAPGANVQAVCAGTVSRVFTTPYETKGVLVRHGAYITVYAGLGNVSVAQGAKIKAGQSLGTVAVGDDNTSEFSFQVWCGENALNPRHWLK